MVSIPTKATERVREESNEVANRVFKERQTEPDDLVGETQEGWIRRARSPSAHAEARAKVQAIGAANIPAELQQTSIECGTRHSTYAKD
jgi:hypothetical protein